MATSGILTEKKRLYEWKLDDIHCFEELMIVQLGKKMRWKTAMIHESDLIRDTIALPDMRLGSTAEFFVKRLSNSDIELLRSTLRALDGKTLTLGSTCSGTDVIVPVFQHTFATLCRIFGAPCRMCSKVCLLPILPHLSNFCSKSFSILKFNRII